MDSKLDKKLKELINSYSRNINILYVEDCPMTQDATLILLENYFQDIDTAKDGQEGLSLFESKYKTSNKYNIVMTDLDMPVLDGISMIKKIREIDNSVIILIFSSYNDAEYILETVNLGIDGYFVKPFNLEQFTETLTRCIKNLNNKLPFVEADAEKLKLIDGFIWEKKNQILLRNHQNIKLSSNEKKLFDFLARSLQSTQSSDNLGSYIFDDYDPVDNTRLRNLISKLKNKLQSELINSSYGVGYKLKTIS